MQSKMSVEQFDAKMKPFKHLLISLTELSATVKTYLMKLTEVGDEIKSLQAETLDIPLRSILAVLVLNLMATYFPHSEAQILIDSTTLTIPDFEQVNEVRIKIDQLTQQYIPSKTILNEAIRLYGTRLKEMVQEFNQASENPDYSSPFNP